MINSRTPISQGQGRAGSLFPVKLCPFCFGDLNGRCCTILERQLLKRWAVFDKVCSLAEMLSRSRHALAILSFQRGRGVPVIVPQQCTPGLAFLSSAENRKLVGIDEDSPYLFAKKGNLEIQSLQK